LLFGDGFVSRRAGLTGIVSGLGGGGAGAVTIGGACRLDDIIRLIRRALGLGRQFSGAISGVDSRLLLHIYVSQSTCEYG